MILKLGSTGDDVRMLQAALRSLGFYQPPATIDGYFGSATHAAVEAFQAARGLAIDGVVGPQTWTAALMPKPRNPPWPAERCWPLRCLADGRRPTITSQHFTRNPERPTHYGVDLFYAYRPGDPEKRIGDSGRTKKWWIPEETYACATWAGRVVVAGNSATGHRVWLEHIETGWMAGYFHLDVLTVKVGELVPIGARIGRVNDNPRDKGDADHLHFETYLGGLGTYPKGTVDPEPMLGETLYLPAG